MTKSADADAASAASWGGDVTRRQEFAAARARLAVMAGVPADDLTVVEVPVFCETLYQAVLEYAAAVPAADGAPARPLYNCKASEQEPLSDSDSDSSASDSDNSCSDCDLVRGSLRRGPGRRRRKVPRPKLVFGMGDAVLEWPPPVGTPIGPAPYKNVVGEGVASPRVKKGNGVACEEGEGEKKEVEKKEAGGEKAEDKKEPQQVFVTHAAYGEPVAVKKKDKVTAVNLARQFAAMMPREKVFLVHAAFGDPVSNHGGGAVVYRALYLASAKGEDAMRMFTAGVTRWSTDRAHRPPRAGRFALFRFKTDPSCRRGWWHMEGLKRQRPMSSVVLPDGQLADIFADVENFLDAETKAWYVTHGLPHRRALMFSGPPGVGKTSCIRAIASEFKLNCCFLSTTCRAFSNQILGDAIASVPENTLLVLEDVDALFNEDRKAEDAGSLTFSGMLNALDGFLSADGIITVMTTNHIERLDAALIRGGRVDRRFDFARPVQSQISTLFLSFYKDAPKSLADEFAEKVFARPEGNEARSIATLQQLFIQERRSSAEECIAALPKFFEQYFPDGSRQKHSLYL